MRVRWLRPALESLRQSREHVATDNPRAALRVEAAVRRAADQLARFPNAGRGGLVESTREHAVTGLPYVIVYRVSADAVEILRVREARTNWAGGMQ